MLAELGFGSIDALVDAVVPQQIRLQRPLSLPGAVSEAEALAELRQIAGQNGVWRSYIGQGYHGTVTPPLLQREILENAGWYTAYTPYQPEIAQGRLEALLNFQTAIIDLTGLPVANASLLDEGTAAAEAMALALHAAGDPTARTFFASEDCHPQTLEVLRTRAVPLGIDLEIGAEPPAGRPLLGALVQYPDTRGRVRDWSALADAVHAAGGLFVVAADPLALALLRAPGEFGADIAIGSTQRFGVPMGFGGPHAAYFAVRAEHQRRVPGRIVGVSKDAHGRTALRLALQTREQHIRRERATSNICTAQVLLAVIAGAYAVYHGPEGIAAIAAGIRERAEALRAALVAGGFDAGDEPLFDTVTVRGEPARLDAVVAAAAERKINLRRISPNELSTSLDETVGDADLADLLAAFGVSEAGTAPRPLPAGLSRTTPFMTHPVFAEHRSETAMLRYLRTLESRDLSLVHSMIPLGSCTMKLNAAAEMLPVTWPEFGALHPFAPAEQAAGYLQMAAQLETWLAEITGFAAVSLQPNAGSQGEYAGLLAIRGALAARGQGHRNVCLVPVSAHGTNPASAVLAGFEPVSVACLDNGDIDLADLRAKADEHAGRLGALMITYPSTHGVFEETIVEICALVHERGGFVYMDGANMNAQVGLCRPGDFGADVCHLNLHKTFCIPHGGGGPGVGPIGVSAELAPFLPGRGGGAVSSAPLGSASILPISWMYIRMMGADGLRAATEHAILNANYVAKRLDPHFPVLYRGRGGLVAHECIIDPRALKESAGVTIDDIAKRLMDYGFHAPTVSWPVAGTLMIEPTESESKAELDRFCAAMVAIRAEAAKIERGEWTHDDSPLAHAPHTAAAVAGDEWPHPYDRREAAFPAPWLHERKFWPSVSRVDGAYGDRNFFCSCAAL